MTKLLNEFTACNCCYYK